ncbi:MAG: TPM domain-containing protein [Deltaproteobacteria bacterium]|nr:TPM domain-containing protein [Deltaproteobacteria bacterium]
MSMWPWSNTRWSLLGRIDAAAVEAAIARAEARTTGEIRVSVAGFFRGDLRRLAERAFRRLGMVATRHRNGVLILVAPTRRQLVILGDQGIHAHVGEAFWSVLTDKLSARFHNQEFTAGLIEAIEHIGGELAAHFPPVPGGDVNELSDAVDVAQRSDSGQL